jgi:hypothetical protein
VFWFTAHAVWVGDLPDTKPPIFIVGLSDTEVGDGESLQIQENSDEQGYCVVAPGNYVFYGGVDSWWLSADTLGLRFTSEAATKLGLPSAIEIEIGTADGVQEKLEAGLSRILKPLTNSHRP